MPRSSCAGIKFFNLWLVACHEFMNWECSGSSQSKCTLVVIAFYRIGSRWHCYAATKNLSKISRKMTMAYREHFDSYFTYLYAIKLRQQRSIKHPRSVEHFRFDHTIGYKFQGLLVLSIHYMGHLWGMRGGCDTQGRLSHWSRTQSCSLRIR
jgi:hypothetical protein